MEVSSSRFRRFWIPTLSVEKFGEYRSLKKFEKFDEGSLQRLRNFANEEIYSAEKSSRQTWLTIEKFWRWINFHSCRRKSWPQSNKYLFEVILLSVHVQVITKYSWGKVCERQIYLGRKNFTNWSLTKNSNRLKLFNFSHKLFGVREVSRSRNFHLS